MENTVLRILMSSVKSSARVEAFDKGAIARRHSSGFYSLSPSSSPMLCHESYKDTLKVAGTLMVVTK